MVGLNSWRWRVAAAAAAVALGLAGAIPATAPVSAYAAPAPAASGQQDQTDEPTSGQGWHLEGTTVVVDGALPDWLKADSSSTDDYNGPWRVSQGRYIGPTWRRLSDRVTSFDIRPGASAKTLYAFFANLDRLTSIKGLKNLKTTGVTDASYMFCYSGSVSGDLKDLDLSSVNTMKGMFLGCDVPVIDMRGVDTSHVTDMSLMFAHTDANSYLFSGIDTSRVTNMSKMFYSAGEERYFEGGGAIALDLTSFDTSHVTDLSGMFESISYFKLLDLSSFDTSSVKNMSSFIGVSGSLRGIVMGPKLKLKGNDFSAGYGVAGFSPAYPLTGRHFMYGSDFVAFQNNVKSPQLYVGEECWSISFDGESASHSRAMGWWEKAERPADPKREGYTFQGWYTDAKLTKPFDFNRLGYGELNITLYPKWVANTYTVAFNANGGSAVASQKAEYGKAAAKPADPTRSGYTFAGWYSDAALTKAYDFKAAVKGNVTLYAKWKANVYTVAFSANGGSAVAGQKVEYGKAVAKPADPKREGYTFQGWYADAALTKTYDFKAVVKGDLTLYARWTKNAVPTPQPKTFTVTFNSNGGSAVASQTVTEGKAVAKPADPKRDGYTFEGWYADAKLTRAYDFKAAVKSDLTLYAKWAKSSAPAPKPESRPSDQFTDVTGASTWVINQGYLDYAVSHGLMTGYKTNGKLNGKFGPEDTLTRGQVAVVLYRVATGKDSGDGQTGFRDAGAYPYYRTAIRWLKDQGLATGDRDPQTQAPLGTFRPDDPITRQELATLVYRFAKQQGVNPGKVDAGSLGKFSDNLQVMPYAREAVAWCNAAGIITGGQGADAGKLMPLDRAQRAQAAKIFTVLHRDVLHLGK